MSRFVLLSLFSIAVFTCTTITANAFAQERGIDETVMAKLGWKVSLQCWTLRNNTLFEAIEIAQGLGIHHLEFFPGQKLDRDSPLKVGPDMGAEAVAKLKAKLGQAGIQAVGFGVTGISANEAQARALFAWAKDLGIEVINTEPSPDKKETLAMIRKLAEEYGIKVGCHNHPKPSTYWNPEFAVDVVKDYGPWLGLCTDTGHYLRSGLVTVDCLKKADGHIVSMHFKDLSEAKRDVPHGTGINHAAEQLAEINRQGFKGVISIEYEVWDDQQHKNLEKCVEFFNREAAQLSK